MTGATGATGGKGATGAAGTNGATGATGEKGATGSIGTAGSASIVTFVGDGVHSGNCLFDPELSGQTGQGACPANGTDGVSSNEVAGPTPYGGSTVSDLYALTSANLGAGETPYDVEVIDNTKSVAPTKLNPGTTDLLIKCQVSSINKNHCEQAGGGVAAAGDFLEVKISLGPSSKSGGPSPPNINAFWTVSFRR